MKLIEAELVQGLCDELGPAFDMAPFLDALPAYIKEHGERAGDAPKAHGGVGDEEVEVAALHETLAVLQRFTSFVDFKAHMLAEKRRRQRSDAAMKEGMAKYFSVMQR